MTDDRSRGTGSAPGERDEISLPKLERRQFLRLGTLGLAALGPLRIGAAQTAQAPTSPGAIDTATAVDTWVEPWVWRPSQWPGQPLALNVVENENPGAVIGLGNPNRVLFSYGGMTPGPTIRMKGDEILYVKLRNLLGEDLGKTPIGPNPDLNELTSELDAAVAAAAKEQKDAFSVIPAELRDDFCLGEHTNGVHTAHVTNLHTHGLHVRPDRNPNGTHSDNVILRVLPQENLRRRKREFARPTCDFLRDPEQIYFLRDDEQVGEADYEFRLGDVEGARNEPHPPGTHWYHPHSHGATHNQVASGMAGFLVVEGDVDRAINGALTGDEEPDPERKTGPYDYRERLMLMQRVLLPPLDPDSPSQQLQKNDISPAINGSANVRTIVMRPGALERWRVLNGSVDGRGFFRFMVLEGEYAIRTINQGRAGNPSARTFKRTSNGAWDPATRQQIAADKRHIYQLAMDGITLVRDGRYAIKDLALQNAGTENPLDRPLGSGNANEAMLRNYEAVFEDGDSIKNCFVRPNEVFLGPANRTDLLFKAPPRADAVYTVFAQAVIAHSDQAQQQLQNQVASGAGAPPPPPQDIVVAHIVVKGDTVPGSPRYGDIDVTELAEILPPVPPYLTPIGDTELTIPEDEAGARDLTPGDVRTRTVAYSGWGSQDLPLVEVPDEFVRDHPELRDLVWSPTGPDHVNVLLPAAIRTMAIDGRKFDPTDPDRPRMRVNTAEEWGVYNNSTMLWGSTATDSDATGTDPRLPGYKQPGYQFKKHYVSYPMSRQQGQDVFWGRPGGADANHDFQVVTKGVDHPFHIHQNPFWVMRIEVPDENGELHNILDEPRWQDAIWIPRHRGRVVFRSRFPDFVGAYVHHCHILLHEDNGMMTSVEVTPFDSDSNYVAQPPTSTIDERYPRLTPDGAYKQSIAFVDPNPITGQEFPGFEIEPPDLDEE